MTIRTPLTALLFAASMLAAPVQDQDKDPSKVTADQQKQNKDDRELTQKIRKSVESDKSLSVAAHNVKIISRDGTVTLRGTVKTDDEKKSIVDKATELAGTGKVVDQINVVAGGSK